MPVEDGFQEERSFPDLRTGRPIMYVMLTFINPRGIGAHPANLRVNRGSLLSGSALGGGKSADKWTSIMYPAKLREMRAKMDRARGELDAQGVAANMETVARHSE